MTNAEARHKPNSNMRKPETNEKTMLATTTEKRRRLCTCKLARRTHGVSGNNDACNGRFN